MERAIQVGLLPLVPSRGAHRFHSHCRRRSRGPVICGNSFGISARPRETRPRVRRLLHGGNGIHPDGSPDFSVARIPVRLRLRVPSARNSDRHVYGGHRSWKLAGHAPHPLQRAFAGATDIAIAIPRPCHDSVPSRTFGAGADFSNSPAIANLQRHRNIAGRAACFPGVGRLGRNAWRLSVSRGNGDLSWRRQPQSERGRVFMPSTCSAAVPALCC